MATTTKLVTQIFDSMFQGEIDDKSGQGSKRRRCGICEVRMLDVIDGIRMSVCWGKFKSIYKHVEYFWCVLFGKDWELFTFRYVNKQTVASVPPVRTWSSLGGPGELSKPVLIAGKDQSC